MVREGQLVWLAGDTVSFCILSGETGKQAEEKDRGDAASSCPDSSEGKRGPRGISIRYVPPRGCDAPSSGPGACLPLAAVSGPGSAKPVQSGALLWQAAHRGGETQPRFWRGLRCAPSLWPHGAVVRVRWRRVQVLGKRCSAVQTKDSGLAFLRDILKPDQEVVMSDSPRLGHGSTGIAGSISGRAGRSKLVREPWARRVMLLTRGMLCLQGSRAATPMARAAARPAAAAALRPWAALLSVARPSSPGTLPRSWEASGSRPQVSGLALISLPVRGPCRPRDDDVFCSTSFVVSMVCYYFLGGPLFFLFPLAFSL